MTTIINCTPHSINIHLEDGIRTFEPSGIVPRANVKAIADGSIDGIPVFRTEFSNVEDLPARQEGVWLLVSSIVRTHPDLKDRDDLLSPDTSPMSCIRNEQGQIVGVKGFQH